MTDDVERFATGLCALGAGVLAASLFLPWRVTDEGRLNAWDTFEVVDLVLVVVVAVAIEGVIVVVRRWRVWQGAALITSVAAWMGLVAILWSISDRSFDTGSLGGGAWLACGALVAIAVTAGTLALRPRRDDGYSGPTT